MLNSRELSVYKQKPSKLKHKLVFITPWIELTMKQLNRPLNDILRPLVLTGISSEMEVSFYVALNNLLFGSAFKDFTGSFHQHDFLDLNPSYTSAQTMGLTSLKTHVAQIELKHGNTEIDAMLKIATGDEKATMENVVLELFDLEANVFGARLAVLDYDETYSAAVVSSLNKAIGFALYYNPLSVVAMTPLFQNFCKYCSYVTKPMFF